MALNELTNTSPYNDDYDSTKNYVGIAAVPGRVLQAREFTQSQTILRDHLKRIGDAVLENGTIVSGCAILISGSTATIDAGKIYLNGMVRDVGRSTVTINGSGTEYIAARIRSSIITEVDDASLKDPATGFDNAGKAGAHRIQEYVQFVRLSAATSTDDVAVIYTVVDGAVKTNPSAVSVTEEQINTTTSVTPEILARRTYDENGSYKVNGLELLDKNSATDNGIKISVSNGKAYINGYEVSKTSASPVLLNYADETSTVRSEPIKYKSGTTQYALRNCPAKALVRVTSLVEVTSTISKGISGGEDELPNTPVDSIISVSASSGTVTYNKTTDYVQDGNYVDWSPSGNEPSNGSTYQVTYRYMRTQVIDTDVTLTGSWDSTKQTYVSKLKFNNSTNYPVNGSTTYVDYEAYLARVDTIVLDQNGEFGIIEGVPELERHVSSPVNEDSTKLVIGTVLIRQGYSGKSVNANLKRLIMSSYNATRLDQAGIQALKKRVDDLEYNVAMSDLDKEAAENENATSLRGVFTDGFVGMTKCDLGHNDFNCSIDLDNNQLTLPVTDNVLQVTPNISSSTSISKIGNVITAAYTNRVALSQPYATERMLINPYAVYNPLCIISLKPSVDNWIDSSTVTVNKTVTNTYSLRRWWKHKNASWAEAEKQKWLQLTGTTGEQLNWANYNDSVTTTTSAMTLDEAVMYMRAQTVNVTGSNFTANADNIACYFDDEVVPLTATGSTTAGTGTGTVKANAKGKFTASFTVPSGVPCGSVSVVLKNGTNTGEATYTAQGRKQVVTNTVLTTKTVVKTNDPLAQSFQFDTDTTLTKVGLYFATKDSSKNLILQVRNMVNGYPGTEVYDEVYVDADDVKVSTTAATETTIEFSQPVYCKADTAYCIVILSDSNEYEAWVATLGQRDVTSNAFVSAQPYVAGVLFSSSNANTWTAHQSSDLKFTLYAANYTSNTCTLLFNNISTSNMNRLLIAAESIDYKNSGVYWYYRISNNDSWSSISTYDDRELSKVSTTVQLKATIKCTTNASPMLAGDVVNLVSFIDGVSGTYISRTVTFDGGTYNKLVCSFEAYKPEGTTIRVYYSTDGGSTWSEYTSPATTLLDATNEINRYEYTATLATASSTYKVRIDMATNNVLLRPKISKLVNVMRYE